METRESTYYSTDRREQYKKRALEADLLKLVIAIVLELLIFLIWFEGPARERYEILVHAALPICIVLPIINSLPDLGTVHSLLTRRGTSDRHQYFTFFSYLAACLPCGVRAFCAPAQDCACRGLRGLCYLGESSHC